MRFFFVNHWLLGVRLRPWRFLSRRLLLPGRRLLVLRWGGVLSWAFLLLRPLLLLWPWLLPMLRGRGLPLLMGLGLVLRRGSGWFRPGHRSRFRPCFRSGFRTRRHRRMVSCAREAGAGGGDYRWPAFVH